MRFIARSSAKKSETKLWLASGYKKSDWKKFGKRPKLNSKRNKKLTFSSSLRSKRSRNVIGNLKLRQKLPLLLREPRLRRK